MVKPKRFVLVLLVLLSLSTLSKLILFTTTVQANPTETLIDSYSVGNYSTYTNLMDYHPSDSSYSSSLSQCFQTPENGTYSITSAQFYLRRYGSPTGNAHAVLYGMKGTFGSDGVPNWVIPTSHDTSTGWLNPTYAYNDDIGDASTYFGGFPDPEWTSFLVLNLPSAVQSQRARVAVSTVYTHDIDVYEDGAWNGIWYGVLDTGNYVEIPFSDGSVTKIRIRGYLPELGTIACREMHVCECLAVSDPFPVSTLTTSFQLINFTFNATQLEPSTYYCIAYENPTSGTINILNRVQIGIDKTSPTHEGNRAYYANNAWTNTTDSDVIFYVYGEAVGGYALNLHVYDWDLTDEIQDALVHKNSDTKWSNINGWANWTGVSGTIQIKVKYFGFWVNGTFSVNVDSDKTINVRCKLYDLTIKTDESLQNAYLVGVNVTVYNTTSAANLIKSGFTNNTGFVVLNNLPNNTLTFICRAKSDWSLVIKNTTINVDNLGEDGSSTITCTENSLSVQSDWNILFFLAGIMGASSLKKKKEGCKEKCYECESRVCWLS